MAFMNRPGGNDVFAQEGAYLTITDLLRGDTFTVSMVDFDIDEDMVGRVYFDEEEILAQTNIESYEVLENLFYSQYEILS
jgi:hypothetical protein